MLDNVPFPMLVLGGGVILAGLFFLAIVIRSRGKGKSIKATATDMGVPLIGQKAISERVTVATRAAELAAEAILDKQEAVVELEKKQAAVDEVIAATKLVTVKN